MERDVQLSLCPGTKKFPCPAVPLSRAKNKFLVLLSLCPGTRAAAKITGQTPLSLDIPGQKCPKEPKIFKKKKKKKKSKHFFLNFCSIFLLFFPFCPVVVPGLSGTGQAVKIPSRPVAKYQNPVPSHVPSHVPSQGLTGCPGLSHPAARF